MSTSVNWMAEGVAVGGGVGASVGVRLGGRGVELGPCGVCGGAGVWGGVRERVAVPRQCVHAVIGARAEGVPTAAVPGRDVVGRLTPGRVEVAAGVECAPVQC